MVHAVFELQLEVEAKETKNSWLINFFFNLPRRIELFFETWSVKQSYWVRSEKGAGRAACHCPILPGIPLCVLPVASCTSLRAPTSTTTTRQWTRTSCARSACSHWSAHWTHAADTLSARDACEITYASSASAPLTARPCRWRSASCPVSWCEGQCRNYAFVSFVLFYSRCGWSSILVWRWVQKLTVCLFCFDCVENGYRRSNLVRWSVAVFMVFTLRAFKVECRFYSPCVWWILLKLVMHMSFRKAYEKSVKFKLGTCWAGCTCPMRLLCLAVYT